MSSPSPRVYRGIDAGQRMAERRRAFLDAGLDMLGSDRPALTVRGVCSRAGLVARYFYEGFADADALAVAVYEDAIQSMVSDTLAALAHAPEDERAQIRTGLAAIVAHFADDPRRGRLILGTAAVHPALSQKRHDMTRMMAGLLTEQAKAFYGMEQSPRLDAVSRFLVGGLSETLTAWQSGDLTLGQEDVVDLCLELFASSASAVTAGQS